MSERYLLYTVTGLREPFYAAVDHQTGKAWTSPTRDGALKQAREHGVTHFVERTVSRAQFLHSMGIDDDPRLRIAHDAPHAARSAGAEPRKAAATAWFMADPLTTQNDALPPNFTIPPRLKSGGKGGSGSVGSGKAGGKRRSPFAVRPINPMAGKTGADADDMLLIPSDRADAPAPTPFVDPPPPDDDDDIVK